MSFLYLQWKLPCSAVAASGKPAHAPDSRVPISCGQASPGGPGRSAGCPREQGRCGRGSRWGSHAGAVPSSAAGTCPVLGAYRPQGLLFPGKLTLSAVFSRVLALSQNPPSCNFCSRYVLRGYSNEPETFSMILSPRLGGACHQARVSFSP